MQAPIFPQASTGLGRSLVLAAFVHMLLLGFLWFGISWQNMQATAVEAEVWDLSTREAAPVPQPVEPEPKPEPVIGKDAPPPEVDPEIALAQKREQIRKEKESLEQKRLELRRVEEKRKAEQLAEKSREKELEKERAKVLEKKKLAEQKAQLAAKAASDKQFKENMQRLAAQAGSGGTGTAVKSTGNNRGDPSYVAKIAAKIRSNTNFNTLGGAENPTVEYRIELLPDGSLRGIIRKLKSSGVAGFDEAVAKGIEKSAPFPRDKDGNVPASLDLVYKMKEE